VRVPTLVMIGTVDEPGGVAAGKHLARTVAGARLVEFPEVAHMIQLEEPVRFNTLVLEFLSKIRPEDDYGRKREIASRSASSSKGLAR